MTYEQYWYGDVWMVEAFREAERLRQERANTEAWLQGMYVYDAIWRIAPALQAFPRKGTKTQPYMPKPYEFGNQKRTEVEQKQLKENERLKSILFFQNWARSAQKKFDGK